MISRKHISHIINKSEIDYLNCWRTLSKMKSLDITSGTGEELVNFQANLAFAIFRLENLYRKIHQEKLYLINRKNNISKIWFNKRMALLGKYKTSIKYAISIGKSIGDAFAWFFYKDEDELLEEHRKHKSEFHMPVGIGGHGELEFIKNIKLLEGNMTLYHGITTFLNLGDVSLINLDNMKVSAIGEIKTKKLENNQLNITIYFIGNKKNNAFKSAKITRTISKTSEQLPTKMYDRLNRQMKRMEQSFISSDKNQIDGEVQQQMPGHYEELNAFAKRLTSSKAIYQKIGSGLLLVGLKVRNKSLASKLLNYSDNNYTDKFHNLSSEALNIIDKNSDYNSISLGTFFYRNKFKSHLMAGMTPLFWWPVNIDLIKNIIFQDVIITTIYNPAHLYQKLEDKGYLINHSDDEKNIEVKKVLPDHHMTVGGFHYFIYMITEYLINEDAIANSIESTYTKIIQNKSPANTTAKLKFKHRIT